MSAADDDDGEGPLFFSSTDAEATYRRQRECQTCFSDSDSEEPEESDSLSESETSPQPKRPRQLSGVAPAASAPPFPTRIVSVPPGFEAAHRNITRELNSRASCVLCGTVFYGSNMGMLGCTFHPFVTYLAGRRSVPYQETVGNDHGNCSYCTRGYLAPALSVGGAVRIRDEDRLYDKMRGCTRIDHCSNFKRLLENPVVAVPTFYASELGLRGDGGTYTGVYLNAAKGNTLLIDKPEQMAAQLAFHMPGIARPQLLSVFDIYTRMSDQFGLDDLQESLRKVKKGAVANSITRMSQLRHPDAARKFSIYVDDQRKAEFIPFFIILRVEQRTPLRLV